MTVRVAVDFGTSSTCVVVSVDGMHPQVVVLDGQPLMSSAVFAAADGTLFVGQEAERHAALDPARYEPHPKRRIDDGQLLLGNTVLPVPAAIRAVLDRAVAEARRVAGGRPVDQLVLTHPADWGEVRAGVLRAAGAPFARVVILVPEPVAAAVFHAASFARQESSTGNRALAVLDLGGGTVDVSVVRRVPTAPGNPRTAPSYEVLATRGDPNFGGVDIDQLLLEHIGSQVAGTDQDAWDRLVHGRDLPDRRRRRVLWQDVRNAKETLSRHTYTDVPLPSPFPDVHLTRADLERLIDASVTGTIRLTTAAITEAGLVPADLMGIFLVGGSSRIPMVARLVHQRCRIIPTILDQPETVVARGALRATAVADPARTGLLPAEVAAGRAGADPADPAPPGTGPVPVVVPQPPVSTPAARPSGRRRGPMVAAVALVVVVLVLAGVLLVVLRGSNRVGGAATSAPGAVAGHREIAQYDYRFSMPPDWKQTGGSPDRRQVQVQPSDAAGGNDQILVQESVLTYDSDTQRQRAVAELRSDFDAAGTKFSDFDPGAHYAGKDVISYRQRISATVSVDWYVVFQRSVQVSVGCQQDTAGAGGQRVRTACDAVVGTLVITQ